MRSENLFTIPVNTGKTLTRNRSIKMSLFLLVMLFLCQHSFAQTLTIINNSKARISYQVLASDKGTCTNQFSSLTLSIEPSSRVVYPSSAKIDWSGRPPQAEVEYTGFKGMFNDRSGACTSDASDIIGSLACDHKQETTLNTTKCNGASGNLDLIWSNKNGNVTVSIK
jgi:hypothetical protein